MDILPGIPVRMRINFPNSAFLGNLEAFLEGYDPREPNRLDISFHPEWVSVHPAVLAMAASLGLKTRRTGGQVASQKIEAKSRPYLAAMGFFKLLGIDQGFEIARHEPAGRFIPLTNINENAQLDGFISDLVPLLHSPPEQAKAINYTISELVRNVFEHAVARDGAVVCAQYYQKTRRVAIGVADAGIGLLESLKVRHAVDSHSKAIELALTPGVTGGTKENMGAGLFFIKAIAKVNREFFVVYSGDSLYRLLKTPPHSRTHLYADPLRDHHTLKSGLPFWQGTVIGVDISTDEAGTFSELLSVIRAFYHSDLREHKRPRKPRFI